MTNSNKGKFDKFFPGEHLKFQSLQKMVTNEYLSQSYRIRNPLDSVKLKVSNLRHDTNLGGFQGILSDCGFKDLGKNLVWWSLAVSESEINEAEKRFLYDRGIPDGTVKSFLHKFTSSPAFKKSSRMGNFRFTFSLTDLLNAYAVQFCNGQRPQMRNYGTFVYKQEVMYAIVVHGPDGLMEFENHPLFGNDPHAVCSVQDEKILWRPEGMSKTHAFKLSSGMKAYRVPVRNRIFYMWDHVAIAFHVPNEKIFKFDKEALLSHLSLCQGSMPKLSNEEFIRCEFDQQ